MPEIAEVARIVHFLRQSLVGKRIATVAAIEDTNVFGKVGTSGPEVEEALKGKKVVSAGSQGKYFWITLEKPPHLVMHFGMTGWVHIRGEKTAYTNYYKKMKESEMEAWPPKFWKFHLKTEGRDGVEVAFTDPRRIGRVRLVHCPGDDIRQHSPLVENGPDPVIDLDEFTEEYLHGKMRARRVPIKALLLDQTVISGIGNWVADETLYQAKFHPEQYCNEFSDAEIKTLYENIRYVCQTAVDKLGDSDEFPDHWLFNYRWGKGGKAGANKLPNGEKLAFITVGGRTSCYAPAVQKKTGRVVPTAKAEVIEPEEDKPAVRRGRSTGSKIKEEPDEGPPLKRQRTKAAKQEDEVKEEKLADGPRKRRRGRS
ncbi:Formamidopyrimidine-DNA glycosylase N-terminal domain-containing protein [Stachybotrys elegans]|uniref:Formamidopyrimidine-DNA glycosylase N-terminal domain-containing protein n=1 Tax=Stachybotrys elegans TaxID=80388 RepID=A0A8K0SSR2_9HYPO|nr:Formamidopyrimidine-DNA glycosylase N-terminal domain-containing protein [Stachybotrys elegans]